MIIRETEIQSCSQELDLAERKCSIAVQSAYENLQVPNIFINFVNAASAKLPECILYRIEGPKGLRKSPLAHGRNKLKGVRTPPVLSRKEVRSYFLPGSLGIYRYKMEDHRPAPRNFMPENRKFVGIPEIRKKGIPLYSFFGLEMGGDFNQMKEITYAIGNIMENAPISDIKLNFRYHELLLWIQACEETQEEILSHYGGVIKNLIPNLRDVIMESSESIRLPSVIYNIKNNYDPYDTTEYQFMVKELRLVSVPEDNRRHRFLRTGRKTDLSTVVDAPLKCWYGAADDIKKGLLAVLPPSWIAALKPRN